MFSKIVFLILVTISSGYYSLYDSPLCNHNQRLQVNYELRSSILLNYTLFLFVYVHKTQQHIIYEVPAQDIALSEQSIYLDNSKPLPMIDKFGFEVASLNKSFKTAFGINSFKFNDSPVPEDIIVFVYEDYAQIFRIKMKKLETSDSIGNLNASMILSFDNQGYLFSFQPSLFAQKCYFETQKMLLELNPVKYFLSKSQFKNYMTWKKTDPISNKYNLNWTDLTGFIFYNQMVLLMNNTAYLLQDMQIFPEDAYELIIKYDVYKFSSFFRCYRTQVDDDINAEDNDSYEQDYSKQPTLINIILMTMLGIVCFSFYLRSRIINNKRFFRNSKSYYSNKIEWTK